MRIVRVIDKALRSICSGVSVILYIIMIFSVFLQIVSRVFFKVSFGWTEELCRYSAAWVGMLMAALVVRERSHIELSMVKEILPNKLKWILEEIGILVILIFSCYLVKYGFEYAFNNMDYVSPGMQIPKGIVYLCIPLGSIITAFNALLCLFSIDKRLDKKEGMEVEV